MVYSLHLNNEPRLVVGGGEAGEICKDRGNVERSWCCGGDLYIHVCVYVYIDNMAEVYVWKEKEQVKMR